MKHFTLIIAIISFQLALGFTNTTYAQWNKLTTVNGNNNKLQITEKGNNYNIQISFPSKKSNREQEKILNKLQDSLFSSLNLKIDSFYSKIDSLNLRVDSLNSLKIYISKQNYSILAHIDSIGNHIIIEKKILHDTITTLLEKYNIQSTLVTELKKIIQEDKATWTYSFVPGLRQYRLGYKTNAYIYWSAYGGSFVSLMLAQKYNTDYRNNKQNFDQTNNPDEQDHYFDIMNLAKRRRNICYTASAWIIGGVYAINLIDALLITNKRKILPQPLFISPVVTKQYTGIYATYTF